MNRKKVIFIFLVVIILLGSAVFYYFKNRFSQEIISAAELQKIKTENLSILMGNDPLWYKKAKLEFLDTRSEEEYAQKHIKRSRLLPSSEMSKFIQGKGEDLVIYSGRDRLSEAEEVSNYIRDKNKKMNREWKVGKIYLIKDGFEGLEGINLPTESGPYD